MSNELDFTFSDLVAGYVIGYDPDTDIVELNTSDGRPYSVKLTDTRSRRWCATSARGTTTPPHSCAG